MATSGIFGLQHRKPSCRSPETMLSASQFGALEKRAITADQLINASSAASDSLLIGYQAILTSVLSFGLHAVIPMVSLAGVLLDGPIGVDLGLSPAEVVASDSVVFLAWIPGSFVSGPVSDAIGRKRSSLLFSLLAAVAIVATSATQPGALSQTWLLTSRALGGFAVGAFMSPCYTLLTESTPPSRTGLASVSFSGG